MKNRKAQVLVIILVVLAVCYAMGAALLYHSRSLRDFTSLQADAEQAYSLEKSGIDIAKKILSQDSCLGARNDTYNIGEGTLNIDIQTTMTEVNGEFSNVGDLTSFKEKVVLGRNIY